MTPKSIVLEVPGRPVAWERVRTNHGRFFKAPRTRDYEEQIAWACRAAGVKLGKLECAVQIHLDAKRRLTGDPDNYSKCVLDGLQIGELIDNDRQVRDLHVTFGPQDEDMTRIKVMWIETERTP